MKRILICLVFVFLFVGVTNAQTKSMTGTVVYYSTGASGNFEIIEVQVGNKKYEVYLFQKDLPTPKIVGTVNEVGRVVRIYYSKIVGGELSATKIVEVKKKTILANSKTSEISEKDLREQMMSDGLRSALDGCEGISVSIKQTKIDLNRDGQTEIIATASSACWGAQGTKTWIYQRADGGLKALLSDADGGYMPNNTSTRGFRDITLSSGSYVDVYTRIFKYNGREYEYFVSKRYQRNKSGKLILKETTN